MSSASHTCPGPPQVGLRRIHGGRVVENAPLCREHYRLVIALSGLPPTAPGQFVQMGCGNIDTDAPAERELDWDEGRSFPSLCGPELAAPRALLRRPFSLAGRRDTADGTEIDIIYRVMGAGTAWLARLRRGAPVSLIGPLGNSFTLPPDGATAILAGGGAGLPPMMYLAERLAGRAVAFCGATARQLLPLTLRPDAEPPADPTRPALSVEEFARHGIPAVVSTDDGSAGFHGLLTEALERYLSTGAETGIVYACGPEAMLRRVAGIAAARGIECQVSVERAMACGMGTCQSCCIRVRKDDPSRPPLAGLPWSWKLACTDGPVFRAADLLW